MPTVSVCILCETFDENTDRERCPDCGGLMRRQRLQICPICGRGVAQLTKCVGCAQIGIGQGIGCAECMKRPHSHHFACPVWINIRREN